MSMMDRMNICRPIAAALLSMVCMTMSAQTIERYVLASGGASYVAGGIRLDHTVGQVATVTLQSAPVILTQGFHQPPVEFNVGIDAPPRIDADMRVYPNPTRGALTIAVDLPGSTLFAMDLFDVAGRIVLAQRASLIDCGNTLHTALDEREAGTYYLRVRSVEHAIDRSFTVIKVN